MALAALIVAFISAAAAIVVGVVTGRQLREARISNALPAVVDMFKEYRSARLTFARKTVFDEVGDEEQKLAISQLPTNARDASYLVSHFLDNLGVLVAERFIDPELVARFLGDTAIALWIRLSPCIINERELRRNRGWVADYQRYFEDLATKMKKISPSKAQDHLEHWPESPIPKT